MNIKGRVRNTFLLANNKTIQYPVRIVEGWNCCKVKVAENRKRDYE
jgi:hypothetical protein